MSVLVSLFVKQVSLHAFSCRPISSVKQAGPPLLSWGVGPISIVNLHKPAYSYESAACSNKLEAFSNVSAAISCLTPGPTDRLHYTRGLPGGGLYIYGT